MNGARPGFLKHLPSCNSSPGERHGRAPTMACQLLHRSTAAPLPGDLGLPPADRDSAAYLSATGSWLAAAVVR